MEARKLTQIFIDCDGVVAAFDQRFIELTGMHPREFEKTRSDKEFWKIIQSTPNYFADLDPMEDAYQLVESVENYCIAFGLPAPIFLTGSPHGDWAQPQKQAWKNKHFPHLEMICVASKNKRDHAKPGDIIIDDWERHQAKWEEMGGHWILHTNAVDSLYQLEEILMSKYGELNSESVNDR